jgi:lysophospholipase L1-like esterase
MVVIIQEFLFRLFFPIPELSNFDRINYTHLQTTSTNYSPLRNVTWNWQSSLDTPIVFSHYMNMYGFRDKEWVIEKRTNENRYMFFGDSFTEGIMAVQGKDMVSVFQGLASNDGLDIETFNAGMMGVGMNSYLSLIVDAVPLFKPDHVVLTLYANDFTTKQITIPETRLLPEYYNEFTPRIVELVQQVLAERPILSIFSTKTRSLIPAVPASNNPWTLDEESLTKHVSHEVAEAMKNGTFNCFIYNQLVYQEQMLREPVSFRKELEFLKQFLNDQSIELSIVYVPYRNQVTQHYLPFEQSYCQQDCSDEWNLTSNEYDIHRMQLAQDCSVLGIHLIDLHNAILKEEENGNHLYWNYDDHFKEAGYSLMANEIYHKLQPILNENRASSSSQIN